MPQAKNVVAIASGKGGVGKSTVSANLALALAKTGQRVGLLDADVYGPSIPTILGVTNEKPRPVGENRLEPVERYGIKLISTGFFVPADQAVIWRGPMLHKMIQDFLNVVDWGELDWLLIDLPPGTGDVQLSLSQTIPLTGAVIVSTPQDVAWNVAQKAIAMFGKLNTPILGVIENMSGYTCGHCGTHEDVFGKGGARRAAERIKAPFLGEVPLITGIRRTADEGNPVVHSDPDSPAAKAFIGIAALLAATVSRASKTGGPTPKRFSPAGESISIDWSDGVSTDLPARELRAACPCAGCVDENTGRRTLDPALIPQNITVTSVSPVGNYALHLAFSDGHRTGLYAFPYLRELAAARRA